MLWVLKRTISIGQFFVYLNLCQCALIGSEHVHPTPTNLGPRIMSCSEKGQPFCWPSCKEFIGKKPIIELGQWFDEISLYMKFGRDQVINDQVRESTSAN